MIREASGYIVGENGLVVQLPPRAVVKLAQSGVIETIIARSPGDVEILNAMSALRWVAQQYSAAPGTRAGVLPEPASRLKYLSTKEAAERARMTDRGIRKAISRGALTAERVGGRWQVTTEALRSYMNNP